MGSLSDRWLSASGRKPSSGPLSPTETGRHHRPPEFRSVGRRCLPLLRLVWPKPPGLAGLLAGRHGDSSCPSPHFLGHRLDMPRFVIINESRLLSRISLRCHRNAIQALPPPRSNTPSHCSPPSGAKRVLTRLRHSPLGCQGATQGLDVKGLSVKGLDACHVSCSSIQRIGRPWVAREKNRMAAEHASEPR